MIGPAYSDWDELQLIRQCQKGDHGAFDELMRRHQDTVFSLCFRLLGDYDDAADLTQDVFLRCFRKIRSFRGEAKFSSWLYRMTVNMAKNFYKHRQRRGFRKTVSLDQPQSDQEDQQNVLQVSSPDPGPRALAAGREEMRLLNERLQMLSYEHREVIVLRYVEGLEYSEIGKVLGVRIGTVKSRINRARNELKEFMKDVLGKH